MSLRRSAYSCLRAALQRSHNLSGGCTTVISSAAIGLPPSAAAVLRSPEYVSPSWSRISALQLTNLRGFSSAPRQQFARQQAQRKVSDQGMYLVRYIDSCSTYLQYVSIVIRQGLEVTIEKYISSICVILCTCSPKVKY